MKKYLQTFLVATAAFFGISQPVLAIPTFAQSYGVGSYGAGGKHLDNPDVGSGSDYPLAIAKMPDGGYVVAGKLDLPKFYATYNAGTSSYASATLVRFAADGSIIWQQVLRQSNDLNQNGNFTPAVNYIYQLATDSQGNIFVAGGKGNTSNGGQQPYVAKLSADGPVVWDNGLHDGIWKTSDNPLTFENTGISAFTTMALTHDGGVVVGSSEGKPGGTQNRPVICKFNSDGSLALHAVYDVPVQYIGVSAVCQAKNSDDYVFLINHPQSGSFAPNPHGMTAIEIDPAGNVVQEKSFPPDDGRIETPLQIVATSDGGYATFSQLAKSYSGGVIMDAGGFVLRKFDASLNTTFEKLYQRPGQNNAYYNNYLSEIAGGGFLVSGHNTSDIPNDVGVYEASLTRISANGAILSVSLLGGPQNEGNEGSFSPGSGTFAIPTDDGGYAFTTKTQSYTVDGALGGGFYYKADWWIVKTDANRQIRNFHDDFRELDLSQFTVTDTTRQGVSGEATRISTDVVVGATPTNQPALILEDLSADLPPSQPTLTIQASSPRMVSGNKAEAVVQQHFSYHTVTAFFADASKVTFGASNLPQGFAIDSKTGVVTGVPGIGSETTTPITIALQATDGTDTASFTLNLTIGDGVPFFTVNGSAQPAYPPTGAAVTDQADKVLTFVAHYPGKQAGRVMSVQATTTPDNEASWQFVTNGTNGAMPFDQHSNDYVLGTTNYPWVNGVYFRARVRSAQSALTSNVVGPFDLASNVSHLGKTNLFINHNGSVANIRFGVTEELIPNGISVRMQATTTPANEGSWSDVTNSGLTQDTTTPLPHEFYGGFDEYPESQGVYFRAVASTQTTSGAPVAGDSVSAMNGPVTFIHDPAATITLTVPGASGSDGTDYDLPLIPSSQSFDVTADAQSSRQIKYLGLLFDGDVVDHFAANHGATLYTTNVTGDHLIEAVATDDLGVIGDAQPVHLRVAPAAPGKIYYVTAAGDWNNSSIWIDGVGNHGVPGANDFAVLSSVNVNLPGDVTVRAVSLNGGTISGAGKLTVNGFFTIGGGRIDSNVDIADGGTLLLINDADLALKGRITNLGHVKFHGKGGITGTPASPGGIARANAIGPNPNGLLDFVGELINKAVAFFQRPAGGRKGSTKPSNPPPSPATPVAEVRKIEVAKVDNSGTVHVVGNDGASLIGNDGGGLIGNDGTGLIGNDGAGLVDSHGNQIVAQGAGNIVAQGAGNIVAQGAGNIVATGGGNPIGNDGAGVVTHPGGSGGANRALPAAAASSSFGFTQSGGELDLNGILLVSSMQLSGGVLSGNGAIIGDLSNDGGFVTPGHSAGMVGVTGNFNQSSAGTLVVEAAGGEPGAFDQMLVGGGAALGGKLMLHNINGYVPIPNDPFAPVTYGSVTGSFSSITSNVSLTVGPDGLVAALDPGQPNPPTGRPANISTRMRVQAGDNVLIGGFIITGPNGSTKKVLIRGMGPTLANAGVPGTLSDPFIALHYPDGSTVVTNDDWQQAANHDQIPSNFQPQTKESALLVDLAPGAYTVIERGAHGETGVGLMEVYDFDGSDTVALGNISTRGFVATGDNVMIGGFIVDGTEPAQILVRATGPSLTQQNVPGAMADPILELHDANGSVITNDDWRETQEAEIQATTIPPSDNKEPAILVTLVPGSYTAIVKGKNRTTGVGLVEAYKIK